MIRSLKIGNSKNFCTENKPVNLKKCFKIKSVYVIIKFMDYKVISQKCIHEGNSFSFWTDIVEYQNKQIVRDYVKYPEASAILAYHTGSKFVLIKQFRYSVKEELLEIPAGKVDSGETPEDCARRELLEETGFFAKNLRKLFEYYPAVGYSSEKIHIFFAYNLEKREKNLDEDEFTDVVFLSYRDVIDMIHRNEIKDAKTMLAFLWLEKFKSNLGINL